MSRNLQNGDQKLPKCKPKPSKIEPKLGQYGSRTIQKHKKKISPAKRRAAYHHVASYLKKMWPTWLHVGIKNQSKIKKTSIRNLMHLGIDFWEFMVGFWEPKRRHVGTQRGPKMDLILKAPEIKNTY